MCKHSQPLRIINCYIWSASLKYWKSRYPYIEFQQRSRLSTRRCLQIPAQPSSNLKSKYNLSTPFPLLLQENGHSMQLVQPLTASFSPSILSLCHHATMSPPYSLRYIIPPHIQNPIPSQKLANPQLPSLYPPSQKFKP